MINTRKIIGQDLNGAPLWEAMELAYPDGKQYWISTSLKQAGFVIHYDMARVISFHLGYNAETYRICTGWGRDVYIQNLIPDAVATLAVKAISDDS